MFFFDNEFDISTYLRELFLNCKRDFDKEDYLEQFFDKVSHEIFITFNQYRVWNQLFKKQIEDLKTELETYRPTKLSGNGQCKCSSCGVVSWTDWFYKYKGKTLCYDCLQKELNL